MTRIFSDNEFELTDKIERIISMLENTEKEYLEKISREKCVPATSRIRIYTEKEEISKETSVPAISFMPGTSTQRPPQINPLIGTSSLARDFGATRERSLSPRPGTSSDMQSSILSPSTPSEVSPKRPADNGSKSQKKRKTEEKKKQQPPQSKTYIGSFFKNKKVFKND